MQRVCGGPGALTPLLSVPQSAPDPWFWNCPGYTLSKLLLPGLSSQSALSCPWLFHVCVVEDKVSLLLYGFFFISSLCSSLVVSD